MSSYGFMNRVDPTDNSRMRPDAIVHLPAGGVIVDSVPLVAISARQKRSTSQHGWQRRGSMRNVQQHVTRLAAKSYSGRCRRAPSSSSPLFPTIPTGGRRRARPDLVD